MFKSLFIWIRNTFGFSKTETNGFMVLIPLMIFLLFAPTLYTKIFSKRYNNATEDRAILDSLLVMWNENAVLRNSNEKRKVSFEDLVIELQEFDPNIAEVDLLQKVGVPLWLAQRILNYRTKGGVFKTKSDLQKIYDFPDSLFRSLEPFIQLPDRIPEIKKVEILENIKVIEAEEKPIVKLLAKVDLNDSDTTGYKLLRGIGSVYASRIIKYRLMLGGFVETKQLTEVYGVSDSLVNSFIDQLVIKESFRPKQLKINLSTFKELLAHPYISYEQAGDILNTKSKYGKFKKDSDLMNLNSFSEIELKKLQPYLAY
jgi:DNA uptake protein ComE-like DNA-binding protein